MFTLSLTYPMKKHLKIYTIKNLHTYFNKKVVFKMSNMSGKEKFPCTYSQR